MELSEHFQRLTKYNQWANQRILARATELPAEQFQQDGDGASYGSVKDTLWHIGASEAIWLSRWKGQPPNMKGYRGDPGGLEAARAALEGSDEELIEYVRSLKDADFDRAFEYTSTEGKDYRRKVGLTLTHLINHSTYHRGEAALMLTKFGHSPGDLDLVVFVPSD